MFDDTPLIRVNDQEALERALDALRLAPVIGVDTESDSFFSYQEKVCLIQLSDSHNDYVIDPLLVKDLSGLGPIFASREVVKVLHGADYDVVCLKRDFGFEFHNLFDTLVASQLLGFPKIGLADLIGRFFGWEIDKKFQRHDWSMRPLLDEHIEYARGDTHWLLALREILIRRLERRGRMRHLREECALLEAREWQGRRFDPDAYLGARGANTLDDRALRVLRELWAYRDDAAKRQNRPVFKVIPDEVLVDIARARPGTSNELERLLPGKAAMKRRYGTGLLDAVERGLADDSQIVRPTKERPVRTGPRPRLRGKQAERVLAELKSWRSAALAADPSQTPHTLASNGVLQNIASCRPRTLDELRKVPDVRAWQVEDHGAAILAALDRADPPHGAEP